MRTRPAGMRSSGSPGSWPPSAAEFRCVPLTLHSHPKTSNLFPESGDMFRVANRAFLTSHAPARGRIGTPPARAGASAHARSRPACSSRHPARQTRRQHPPLPPGRLNPLADPHPPIVPAAFRKLDAVAVLTGPSLPVPYSPGPLPLSGLLGLPPFGPTRGLSNNGTASGDSEVKTGLRRLRG